MAPRRLAALALAAALFVGTGAGAAALLPGSALAQTAVDATSVVTPPWITDALRRLVDDGTLTDQQADAVASAIAEARPPHRGHGHHRHRTGGGPRLALEAVAQALDLEPAELRQRLRAGATMGELAEEAGVDREAVVEALISARRHKLAEAVEEGRLTQEQADAKTERITDWASAVVDGRLARRAERRSEASDVPA